MDRNLLAVENKGGVATRQHQLHEYSGRNDSLVEDRNTRKQYNNMGAGFGIDDITDIEHSITRLLTKVEQNVVRNVYSDEDRDLLMEPIRAEALMLRKFIRVAGSRQAGKLPVEYGIAMALKAMKIQTLADFRKFVETSRKDLDITREITQIVGCTRQYMVETVQRKHELLTNVARSLNCSETNVLEKCNNLCQELNVARGSIARAEDTLAENVNRFREGTSFESRVNDCESSAQLDD